jgi:hypothetical protein
MKVEIEQDAGDRLSGRNAAKKADEPSFLVVNDRPDDRLQDSPVVRLDPALRRLEQFAEHPPERRSGPDGDRICVRVDVAAQNEKTPAPGIGARPAMGSDKIRKPADGVPPGYTLSIREQLRGEERRRGLLDDVGDDAVDDKVDEPERKNVAEFSLDVDFADTAGPEFKGVPPDRPGEEAGEAPTAVEDRVQGNSLHAHDPALGGGVGAFA